MNPVPSHPRMRAIDRHHRAHRLELALVEAHALRQDLAAMAEPAAAWQAWALSYEVCALHGLRQWRVACTLLESHHPLLDALVPMHHAHCASLAMECMVRAGRADRLVVWAERCFFQHLRGGNEAEARVALETALVLATEAQRQGHRSLHVTLRRSFAVVRDACGRTTARVPIPRAVSHALPHLHPSNAPSESP